MVVRWPCKFGPQGGAKGTWDSDYCQYGILEHARHRFLPTAQAVLQSDIDEFVITEGGISVFDVAVNSSAGYLLYGGRWVNNATDTLPEPASRRHKDYRYCDPHHDGETVRKKWTVVPRRCPRGAQWRVHDVVGMAPDRKASRRVSLRHFTAINTNWRQDRWQPGPPDSKRHKIDRELARWLDIFDKEPQRSG